ncbi:hypothetical protein VTO42DRAFT_2884 [Malbranchea cinnamomea]
MTTESTAMHPLKPLPWFILAALLSLVLDAAAQRGPVGVKFISSKPFLIESELKSPAFAWGRFICGPIALVQDILQSPSNSTTACPRTLHFNTPPETISANGHSRDYAPRRAWKLVVPRENL